MNNSSLKKALAVNLAFWLAAIVAFPLMKAIPTGSGNSPKIFELLVPLFQLMLAGGSTYLIKVTADAQKKSQ